MRIACAHSERRRACAAWLGACMNEVVRGLGERTVSVVHADGCVFVLHDFECGEVHDWSARWRLWAAMDLVPL